MPDFIIIGAAKSGTSALFRYLAEHPQIFMSAIKETNFFALLDEKPNFDTELSRFSIPLLNESQNRYRESMQRGITSFEDYTRLFEGASYGQAKGEISPFYLYHPYAAQRIKHYAPSSRLIAILRNPAERAYSQYMQYLRDGREDSPDFISAIKKEPINVDNVWWGMRHYIRAGFYYKQLRRYYKMFPDKQICILLYEDLRDNPIKSVSNLLEFIGVDPHHPLDLSAKYNVSGLPKLRLLQQLLYRPNPIRKFLHTMIPKDMRDIVTNSTWYSTLVSWNLRKRNITLQERRFAINYYLNDIKLLQDLIQRDLSRWME